MADLAPTPVTIGEANDKRPGVVPLIPSTSLVLVSYTGTDGRLRCKWDVPGGVVAGVASFNGRAGAVVPVAADYAASQVTNDSTVVGSTVKDALNTLKAAIPTSGVTSWNGRTGIVTPAASDYATSQVTNDSSVTGAFTKDALNTLWGRTLTAGNGLTGGGDLSANRSFAVAAADSTITVGVSGVAVGSIGNGNLSNNTIALARLVNATGQNHFLMRTSASAGAWQDGTAAQAGAAIISGFGASTMPWNNAGAFAASTFTTDGLSLLGLDHIQGPSTGTFPTDGFVRVKNGFVGPSFVKASGTGNIIGMYLDSGDTIQVGQRVGSWVCPANIAITFDSAGSFAVKSDNGTTATNVWVSTATGHDAKSLPIANVTTLNGARVLAPTQGSNLTDASVTINISGGANYYLPTNTLSANRVLTLGTTGVRTDIPSIVTLRVESQASFPYTIKDDAGTTLVTITAATALGTYDFAYNTTSGHYQAAGWKPGQ